MEEARNECEAACAQDDECKAYNFYDGHLNRQNCLENEDMSWLNLEFCRSGGEHVRRRDCLAFRNRFEDPASDAAKKSHLKCLQEMRYLYVTFHETRRLLPKPLKSLTFECTESMRVGGHCGYWDAYSKDSRRETSYSHYERSGENWRHLQNERVDVLRESNRIQRCTRERQVV